jgi:polyisoprenoid-binding protein YceI
MTNHTMQMKTKIHFLLALACLSTAALAAPPGMDFTQTFDFKDPKGVNNAAFKLDAPLEAISGNATGISGTVTFDPTALEATKGKIVVATASLHVGNSMQQQHMLSDKWLDAAKYPEISFEAKALKNIKTSENAITADVTGAFTLKGISKDITVPVKFTYLKDKLGQRVPNQKGDLLVIRANFSIKRSDFGLMPGQMEEKVSDTIELTLSIAGASPR